MKRHISVLIKHLFVFLCTLTAAQMPIPALSWTAYGNSYPNSAKIFFTKKNVAVNDAFAQSDFPIRKTLKCSVIAANYGFSLPDIRFPNSFFNNFENKNASVFNL
ncbi:MAG TPA: hypothetical protein P5084_06260 [Paludibacter sp.]|nr:hypothetical protein [Paludibacter sp.]